jgi:prefoldin subunit 5
MAKGKFGASKEALDQFKEGWETKTTLIPLTGSMWVLVFFLITDSSS